MKVKLVILMVAALLLAGCAQVCPYKDAIVGTADAVRTGYDKYVKESKTNDKDMILIDQIASITGPLVDPVMTGWCPPKQVVDSIKEKEAQLKVPLAQAAAGK